MSTAPAPAAAAPHGGGFAGYARRYRPQRYRRYLDRLDGAIGHRYPFSTTPLFLSQERLERLFATVRSLVRLLRAPAFQRYAAAEPWFLPWHPPPAGRELGCVDFHLQGDEERIIEVNFNPPGRFGLLERMEEELLAAFKTPTLTRLNEGFEAAVVAAATADDPSRRVAIAVNPTASSRELLPHYRYVASFFRRHGVAADVVFADAVEPAADGTPRWDGRPYDVVFNLLIARTWQDHPELFGRYSELYRRRPDLFYPSPCGARLGDKRLLTALPRLDEEDFGLEAEDVESLKRAALPAVRLSEVPDAAALRERFGGGDRLVLKPFDNYRGNGVFVQPTPEELAAVFAGEERDNYLAQELFLAEESPCLAPDGGPGSHPFEVRVGFLGGEARTVRGSSCVNLDMTPAVVV